MKHLLVVILLTSFVLARPVEQPAPEPRVFTVPTLVVDQRPSAAMQKLLATYREQGLLEKAEQWEPLAELPDWVFQTGEREIGYVAPIPLVIHSYRYAVIARTNGEVVVVRAGGLSGGHEYFKVPAKPAAEAPPARAEG